MIFYHHFGLSGAPFQFTPSPNVMYASPAHSNGLAALESSLTAESAAITLLTGAAGSGKTTLAMAMLAREWERSRVVYLANPKAGWRAMLREISRQLGVGEHGSGSEMAESFGHYLASLTVSQRILVMIDEAHYLNDASCDQIEEFLNSGRNGLERLSLALIGEPELLQLIASPKHQSLQELTASLVMLKPLPLDEAMRYVEYRLAAFNGNAAKVFAPGALDYLLRHADGLPRQINILCHNAMLMAHASQAVQVSPEIARASMLEFRGGAPAAPTAGLRAGGNSTRQSTASDPRVATAKERPAGKMEWAPHGMGIGLLILSVVVMSALWLAAISSEERLSSNEGDAEVPAIFEDDINVGNESTTAGNEPDARMSLQGEDSLASRTGDSQITGRGGTPATSEHQQVRISQTNPDGKSSGGHGSGFGS